MMSLKLKLITLSQKINQLKKGNKKLLILRTLTKETVLMKKRLVMMILLNLKIAMTLSARAKILLHRLTIAGAVISSLITMKISFFKSNI